LTYTVVNNKLSSCYLYLDPWSEKTVFPTIKDNQSRDNQMNHLEITEKEYNAMITQKGEHWIQLPSSVSGSCISFMIVNHEILLELNENIAGLEKHHDYEDEQKRNKLLGEISDLHSSWITRVLMLFFEMFLTFLIQGTLIIKVYQETPPPFEIYSPDENPGGYGFCYESLGLYIAAIATLCLWSGGSFSDIWTEIRCYISRTCEYL